MKKILFGILTFFGIGFSFCSAFDYYGTSNIITSFYISADSYYSSGFNYFDSYCGSDFELGWCYQSLLNTDLLLYSDSGCPFDLYDSNYSLYGGGLGFVFNVGDNPSFWLKPSEQSCGGIIYLISLPSLGGGSSSFSDIDVYYNNGNSVENITCDGTQAISINGLSTITSTNTFTPYYNISYTDEDNQSLVESYSKDILYLENGQFKKTYTGNNDWILTVQGGSDNSFSGYLPIFDITGGIEEVSESGNIFNNFAENSVKFTLSNIPSYIQYVILLFILFFILGFIRKFRRK